jgi:nucleoside-diphosphate-sugar epimerase
LSFYHFFITSIIRITGSDNLRHAIHGLIPLFSTIPPRFCVNYSVSFVFLRAFVSLWFIFVFLGTGSSMRIIVTGAAGFIGSTLSESLIGEGFDVTGIDCFTGYYHPATKRANLVNLSKSERFSLIESDLMDVDSGLIQDAEVIFHLAGQPGVRASWGKQFADYVHHNILTTQRLLETVKDSHSLKRLVFASSSSIYGNCVELPLREDSLPGPVSPYGVTKLTAEHLCSLYRANYGIPAVSLRYFSVYGPRQRPDMAFNRFFRAALAGGALTVFGDGSQTRDFTYVEDIVRATKAAGFAEIPEEAAVMNIGSGRSIPLAGVIDLIGEITGRNIEIEYSGFEKGDMRDTFADISMAREILGYSPQMEMRDGLREEYEWMKNSVC